MEKGARIIADEIEEALSLENRYKVLNDNIFPMLSPEEQEFLLEVQKYCLDIEPSIDWTEDVYVLFPKLGERGYIQRLNLWRDFEPHGIFFENLTSLAVGFMDPELELARIASGILCGNPTFQHGGTDALNQAQDDLMTGEKIGCVCITEPNRGSDAVNMETTCEKEDDGSVKYTGTKVFTTNGAKADYFAAYAVYDTANPRDTMVQAMYKREYGVRTERLWIQSVPRVHISKTIFRGARAPEDMILGDNGQGYKNLFDGLVPERLSINGGALAIAWNSLVHGIIYGNLRKQFDLNLMNMQGIAFPMGEMLAEISAATAMEMYVAREYDTRILGKHPDPGVEKGVAALTAQAKYLSTRLAHKVAYEIQQFMGGISVTDNTHMDQIAKISDIQEVIGGHRNVMLLLIQNQMRKQSQLIKKQIK
ncbi:MAG TPA: acyl-CoA dehydrogenase [Candidatus Lokiarchaeia archaeon]|nr:acyl-CoA dehydrogenase [Candidatus Lokiarchaeia archaeon]